MVRVARLGRAAVEGPPGRRGAHILEGRRAEGGRHRRHGRLGVRELREQVENGAAAGAEARRE